MGTHKGWLFSVVLVACGSMRETPLPPAEESVSPQEETSEPAASQASEPAASDPHALPTTIDGLVAHFGGSHGLWVNGLTPTLELPATASARAVLEDVFRIISFDEGPVSEFSIIDERLVHIDEDEYQALRLSTDQGPKIALMRYQASEWWVRVYLGEP